MLRVDVDHVAATVELDGEAWTPELIETILRMCGEEVVRTTIALGVAAENGEADDGDEAGAGV
jgi:hypothetical protein